jgi:hypothetical protein
MLLLMMIFFVFPTNFAVIASQQTALSSEAITMIMVGLDVVAFFVGLVFGGLMHTFRRGVKYFAPLFFLLGYLLLACPECSMVNCPLELCSLATKGTQELSIILGSAFIGIANGVGVPYLNTIASIKGGKNSATTVMPLLSAALYLGQFVSPLVVIPLSHSLFGADLTAPYKVAILLCLVFLVQVFATRHFQSLPPAEKR